MATYKTSWVQRLVDNVWTKTFAFAHAKTVYTDYENGKTLDKSLEEINEENTQQSTEMMDIKMLGWSVPRECPIQNEVNGDKFIQKVGRVDLGSLEWLENNVSGHERLKSAAAAGTTNYMKATKSNDVTGNIFSSIYTNISANDNYNHVTDKSIAVDVNSTLWVYDSTYTDATAFKSAMQGQYLYYELATPITTTIDGNEVGETVVDVRKETTVNLLNANQPSSVTSGVTKTNNGDGTYTIQGTATQIVYTNIGRVDNFETGVYKLTGTKVTSGNAFLYVNGVKKDGSSDYSILTENTKPISLIDKSSYTYLIVGVAVANGVTVDETIKPMLTTNLSATYDDFVPYTGDAGSLNGDVADLRGDVDGMLTSVEVRKVYYNLAGNSFDSETAGKTMIANVNFANFKNKSMIVSGDFIISSLPFTTTKKGDYLEVRLSKSDYPDLASKIDSGIKKLAFGISGDFSDKVVGHVNCGLQDDYIRIWLTFNDTYNFNTADLQSGIADFFF